MSSAAPEPAAAAAPEKSSSDIYTSYGHHYNTLYENPDPDSSLSKAELSNLNNESSSTFYVFIKPVDGINSERDKSDEITTYKIGTYLMTRDDPKNPEKKVYIFYNRDRREHPSGGYMHYDRESRIVEDDLPLLYVDHTPEYAVASASNYRSAAPTAAAPTASSEKDDNNNNNPLIPEFKSLSLRRGGKRASRRTRRRKASRRSRRSYRR